MIVAIKWLEPDEGSWVVSIPGLTESDVKNIRSWVKKEVGQEYGVSIPAIRVMSGDHWEKASIGEFASALRYDTGEGIYRTNCPVFSDYGIVRS